MQNITIEELRKVIALSDLSDQELKWILDHSEYQEFQEGEVVVKKGDPIDGMWIMVEGSSAFYMDINGQQVYFYSFDNSPETGGVGGLLPYSRMKTSPGYGYAVSKIRSLMLHKKHFTELEKISPVLIQRCIAHMTDRARTFATLKLQHEKVSALGKLSAGIAHELNNPASAISRISTELSHRLMLNFDYTRKLLLHCVEPKIIEQIHLLLENKHSHTASESRIPVSKKLMLEDELAEWLTQSGITKSQELTETFVSAGITIDDLQQIKNIVSDQALEDVLLWSENLVSSQKIIYDLGTASGRISKLVGAIKNHVHMDRTNDVQPTNVAADIDNTLILLGHKLREKNIEVKKNYPDHLPAIDAYVGELNQVWMNVFDNAIFAMDKNGKLNIDLFIQNNDLKVSIVDNGNGIPPEVLPRIFDPFFTTKKVGQGTGIGLDIVSRIIKHHNGDIKVNSIPGRTEFRICIPIHQQVKINPIKQS